jgi:hypothetical protein
MGPAWQAEKGRNCRSASVYEREVVAQRTKNKKAASTEAAFGIASNLR